MPALIKPSAAASPLMPAPELAPFAADLRARLRDLEDEYRRSQGPEAEWTADRLRALLRTQLSGDQVIVVSNREPYIHERTEGGSIAFLREPHPFGIGALGISHGRFRSLAG